LQTEAYAAIRQALVAGRFKPGDAISVRIVCEALALKTMPAREAVQRLIAERALEFSPNKTVRVPVYSFPEFTLLIEICAQLEALAVRKAASLRTVEQVSIAKRRLSAFRSAVRQRNVQLVLNTNADFWFQLYSMSGSPPLIESIAGAWLRLGPLLQLPYRRDADVPPGQPLSFHDAGHDRRLTEVLGAIERSEPRRAESLVRQISEHVLRWFRANSGLFRLD
jgi:DNA-binding GntR family transcriptional regulator